MTAYKWSGTAASEHWEDVPDSTSVGAFAFIGGATIGENVDIGAYCEIRDRCEIGARTTFGSRCTLSAGTKVGTDCVIKYGFVACDTPDLEDPTLKVPPVIGDNVKIGANVTVMPGVRIGDGATIGACSQVRRDVPAGETWYGNPAQLAVRWMKNVIPMAEASFDCGNVSVKNLRDGPE